MHASQRLNPTSIGHTAAAAYQHSHDWRADARLVLHVRIARRVPVQNDMCLAVIATPRLIPPGPPAPWQVWRMGQSHARRQPHAAPRAGLGRCGALSELPANHRVPPEGRLGRQHLCQHWMVRLQHGTPGSSSGGFSGQADCEGTPRGRFSVHKWTLGGAPRVVLPLFTLPPFSSPFFAHSSILGPPGNSAPRSFAVLSKASPRASSIVVPSLL